MHCPHTKKKSKDAILVLGLLPFYSANSVHRRRRITYINIYFDLFLTPLIYFFNTLLTYDLPKISTFCSDELLLKSLSEFSQRNSKDSTLTLCMYDSCFLFISICLSVVLSIDHQKAQRKT